MPEPLSIFDLVYTLFVQSLEVVFPLVAMWQISKIRADLAHLSQHAFRLPAEPTKPRILVPGKGIFSQAKEKTRPTVLSDADIWAREQDQR